ncbi:MAG: Rne/Rng family ribonuclease, partial [Planctomycetes bacterium]|nr:Rne/Rng family ribonuclease [Planctomycetota bacterium]
GVRHRQRRDAGAQSDRVPRIQQAPFEAQPDEANDPPPPRIDDDRDFNAKGDNDNTNQQRRPRRRGGRGRGRGGRGRRGGSGGQGNGGGPQSWSPRDGNQSPRSEPGNFSQGSWNDGAREPNGFRDAPGTDDGDGPVRYFRRENFPRVQNLFRRGQEVLVQVLKAAQGGKGPGVTTYISLPGRYMVLMPNTTKCGVSRKIFDHQLRNELRRALRRLKIPRGMGVIIRTAAAGRPIEELQRDLNYLLKTWNEVLSDLNSGVRAPSCSYRDSDPAMRTVRDYFTHDVSEIVIDNESVYKRVLAFFDELMPDYRDRVKLYSGKVPLFMAEGVEPQVDRIFDKRVSLPSGGYLYVEQTEALVAIDVNSGRFTSERDAEETAFKTNLEAIPEIARQLRLRDLGGIIVNDFIDMQNPRHRREIEDKLRNELQKERTRVKVSHVSPFGLIEMTRQRVRPSLRNFAFETCKHCQGAGMIKSPETQALHVLRVIKLIFANDAALGAVVQAPPAVLSHLHSQLRPAIADIETSYNKHVSFEWAGDLGSEELRFFFINYRGDRTTFDHHAEIGRYSIVRTASPVNGGEHGHRRRRRGGRGRRRGGGSDRFAPVQQGASDSNRMTSVAPQEVPQTVAVAAEPAAAPETRKTTRGARTKRASRKVTAAALEVSQASGEEAAPAKKTRRKTTRKAASGERPVTRRRTARKKPEPPAGDAPQS